METKALHSLKIINILDFFDYPILTLEVDKTDRLYLSLLVDLDEDKETRLVLPISKARLTKLYSKKLSIYQAFKNPEVELYKVEYDKEGNLISSAIISPKDFLNYRLSENYTFDVNNLDFRDTFIQEIAQKEKKTVLDFYINANDLSFDRIKVWAIDIFTNFRLLVENLIGLKLDEVPLTLSTGSLGATFIFDYEKDLFNLDEEKFKLIIDVFNAETKEDLEKFLQLAYKEKYIEFYTKILEKISKTKATFQTIFINPSRNYGYKALLTPEKTDKIIPIVKETFDVIEDVFVVKGKFLKLDFKVKQPTFAIETLESEIISGKINNDLIERIKNENIELPSRVYKATIKKIIRPAIFRPEKVENFLIDYSLQ